MREVDEFLRHACSRAGQKLDGAQVRRGCLYDQRGRRDYATQMQA